MFQKTVRQPNSMNILVLIKYLSVEYLNTLEQHDKALISYVRGHLLVTPSPRNVPYNLQDPNVTDGSQYGQVKELLGIFKNKVLTNSLEMSKSAQLIHFSDRKMVLSSSVALSTVSRFLTPLFWKKTLAGAVS